MTAPVSSAASAKRKRPAAVVARSLADDLRSRSDEELGALLDERPDLTHPVPADLGALAVRATVGVSAARALDRLDRFGLDVVDALCVLPDPTTSREVAALVGADGTAVELVLDRLRVMSLWWGSTDEVHLVRVVRDVVGQHPAGLGPPGPLTAGQVAAALADAPEPAIAVLRRLDADGPIGQVGGADRVVTAESARTPVEWLLARSLLTPVDGSRVALPREVGLALRGGLIRSRPQTAAPELDGEPHDPARVSSTAAHAASVLVAAVEKLLEAWSFDPPAILRSGGLSVRDLKLTAALLDVDERGAALVVETAYAAGLIADSGDLDPAWVPTAAYDGWVGEPVAERWVRLAAAWLATSRVSGLANTKDDRGNRLAPLGPDIERSAAVEMRTTALEEAATLPAGTAVQAADVSEVLAWRRPRRSSRLRDQLVVWALEEAELIGVTGLGALTEPGRALLAGDDELAVTLLAAGLPAPVDKIVLQADLTAVAPGPLASALAREVALMADVESTGGATVYRFSERSVRRALDAGRDAADLQAFLERSSLTPVPQPLTYLVDDVARRHGALRVGTASSYLRCDDESVVAELLADRRGAPLRLRRLAPTVVASSSPVEVLLARLRELGYAPMAESADGAVVVHRPDARRAPTRRVRPVAPAGLVAPSASMRAAAVKAMRAGERAAVAGAGARGREAGGAARPSVALTARTSADTLAALREAAEQGRTVWIGYSDNHGATTERVVDPVRVSGGFLTAFDHRSGSVRTFAVHRVTGLAPADPADPTAPTDSADPADPATQSP